MHNVARSSDRLKLLYSDGTGLCLFSKRLSKGRFVWPITRDGVVTVTPAQMSMLIEGIDCNRHERPRAWGYGRRAVFAVR